MDAFASFGLDPADPWVWMVGAAVLGVLFLFLAVLRASRRAAAAAEPLEHHISQLTEGLRLLAENQQAMKGGLDTLGQAQARTMQTVEQRLGHVQSQMQERLHENALKTTRAMTDLQAELRDTLAGNSEKTTKSLTQLQERLAVIDRAQGKIEKLSGDVLSLQDILSNKQTRGAFGEIQLNDIVAKALPPDAFTTQAQLSNGRRADVLVHLPAPPGPIVIDAKFPLEAYEALRAASTPADTQAAGRALRTSVRKHVSDIAERYIIDGETAEGALMFLPSEAVYAELHANFADVVRDGFAARVWIVSPTTCMATLNTMRAVMKDHRMKEQAGAIRKELGLLGKDVERLETRVGNLDRHFAQAAKDIDDIKISASKAGARAHRLDSFDFDALDPGGTEDLAQLSGDA
ncbi:MAG: DNA recombination protein RmuC [Pseudomonadota bacterium]